MDFSEALDALKQGRKVTRQRWTDAEGRDQWIVRQEGYPQGIPLNRNTAQATGLPEGSEQKFAPYYMLYTIYSTFVPWTPGTGDLNADDWEVYYLPGEEERLSKEETEAILADPETMQDLAEALTDDTTFSAEEVGVALQMARFEKADISDKDAARFRLIRTLLQPVIDKQRAEDGDPPLFPVAVPMVMAEALHGFVGVIIRLQGDLEAATKDIRFHEDLRYQVDQYLDVALGPNEEDGAGSGLLGEVMLLGRQRDEARANLAATELGSLMDGVDVFGRFAIALVPTLCAWRDQLREGGGMAIDTDGWALTVNGRRENALADRVTSVQMELRDALALEAESRMMSIVNVAADPERTQELVKPGDPGYPTRPPRLADAMRLRQSFPAETPDSPEPEPPQQP